MGKIVGIDIGGSTTKIIGLDGGKLFSPILVKATDPIASLYGALGRFLSDNALELSQVERLMVTGVGAAFIEKSILNIPTTKVNEFQSIGNGGLWLTGLDRAIIVSMGTGTAFVVANGEKVTHLGGTGVGGGTLLGLSNRMLNIRNFDDIVELAKSGELNHVDLSIGDMTAGELVGMPPDTTASNFGKLSDMATPADMALGIINLVFQTIGMLSVFASRTEKIPDVVLTGNLTNVPQIGVVFGKLSELFNVKFHIPETAEYATAAGAAILGLYNG